MEQGNYNPFLISFDDDSSEDIRIFQVDESSPFFDNGNNKNNDDFAESKEEIEVRHNNSDESDIIENIEKDRKEENKNEEVDDISESGNNEVGENNNEFNKEIYDDEEIMVKKNDNDNDDNNNEIGENNSDRESEDGDDESENNNWENNEHIGPIKEAVYLIEVDRIKPNSQQPRRYFHPEALKELSESIREFGILQPLILTKIEKRTDSGVNVIYELIAGERRWRAAQLLGLTKVPAIVRERMEEKQKLEAAIIENVQREDLNPIETARAYAKLADEFGLPQREVAKRIGISREAVSNALRLLQLPTEAQKALMEQKISESHARIILTISNPEKQRGLLGEILSKKLTVRETSILAKRFIPNISLDKKEKEYSANNNLGDNRAVESSIQSRLEEILGTKVDVKKKGEKGKITINFFSEDELLEILKKIVGKMDD